MKSIYALLLVVGIHSYTINASESQSRKDQYCKLIQNCAAQSDCTSTTINQQAASSNIALHHDEARDIQALVANPKVLNCVRNTCENAHQTKKQTRHCNAIIQSFFDAQKNVPHNPSDK